MIYKKSLTFLKKQCVLNVSQNAKSTVTTLLYSYTLTNGTLFFMKISFDWDESLLVKVLD